MSSNGERESSGSGDDRLENIADSYLERLLRGENPSIEEYASAHPDLAGKIHELLPTLRFVEKVNAPTAPGSAVVELPDTRPSRPERIGEYRIIRELGRGGMGIVFEAVQESLGRRVALKLLPSWAQMDDRRLTRFRDEAKAAAALQHPNIVQVYGIGEEGGVPYYAMQFIEGPGLDRVLADLRRLRGIEAAGEAESRGLDDALASLSTMAATGLIASEGPPAGEVPMVAGHGASEGHGAAPAEQPPPETGASTALVSPSPSRYFANVVCLVIQVADALAYAHEQGVIHRDIKPSNLLLDRSGRVWITDFGLAKVGKRDDITRSGEVLGTPRYMAPERFRGWSDPRSDVYGLGITLYELLTLRPAFEDSDPSDLLRKVSEAEPMRPRRIDPHIPRDIEVVVLKAIAREPAERYQAISELAEDLRRYLRGEPVLAHPTSTWRRSAKWARRRPAVAALVAMTILAAMTILGLTLESRARLRAENEKARANLVDALSAVKSMLVRFGSDNLAVSPDSAYLRRGLLEEALQFHRRFLERSPDDPIVVLEAARLQRRMAEIQIQSGSLVEAKESLGRAREILEPWASRDPPGGEIRKESDSLGEQILFLEKGGIPASSVPVNGFFVSRGANVVDAKAADLDSDGRMELIAANNGTKSLTVLRLAGPREFRAGGEFPLGLDPYQMVVGEFDGKKGADVAAYSRRAPVDCVSIALNRGDGTFGPPLLIAPRTRVFSMAAADLDGDGRDELAVFGDLLQIVDLSGEGKPVLGEEIRTPQSGNSLAAGDFDRDGNVDLAAGCYPIRTGVLWIRWGDGKGGASGISELPCTPPPFQTLPADLDGDGFIDLAIWDNTTNRFAVGWNDGKRSFQPGEPISIPQALVLMAAGDFDGDGDVDLVFTFEGEGRVSIILNEGGRKFSPAPPFLTGGRALFGSARDVDGDGQLDLVIANGATDDVAVMFRLREYLQAACAERQKAPESALPAEVGGQEDRK